MSSLSCEDAEPEVGNAALGAADSVSVDAESEDGNTALGTAGSASVAAEPKIGSTTLGAAASTSVDTEGVSMGSEMIVGDLGHDVGKRMGV